MPVTNDNLKNFVTNLGTSADKSEHSFFVRLLLNKRLIDAVYTSGGVGGKIIDCVAEDSGRKWRRPIIPGQDPKAFTDLESTLQVNSRFVEATRWARMYGGAAILMDIQGDDPEEALIPKSVNPNKPVTALHVRDRHDLSTDLIDRSTGIPERYTDVTTGIKWDKSRVLGPFDGAPLPAELRRINNGWAESVLARPYRSLMGEATAAQQITSLIHEAVVDVVGVTGLSSFLDGGTRQRAFEQRYALSKQMKSVQNVFLYDADYEKWETRGSAGSLAGLAPLLERFANRIASEVDIPMSRLYGQLASGLTTSIDGNMADYHAMVAGWQKFRLGPHLQILDALMCRSVYGMVPEGLSMEWVPLGEPSAKEKAETLKTLSEAMQTLWTIGAITPAHVVEHLASDRTIDISEEYLKYVRERDGLTGGPPPSGPDNDGDDDAPVDDA